MNYLHEGLIQLGFDAGDFHGIKLLPLKELEDKMSLYIQELQTFNAKFDLINTDDYDQIVIRHILDSLSAARNIAEIAADIQNKNPDANDAKDDFIIADIGSGAGLPGIPLSAAFPELRFMLIERMTKRCAFLENCISRLALKNATVQNNQAERIPQNSFDIAVFRAFRPLEKKMMHVLRRILKQNGKLAAYKARLEKINEEMSALAANAPEYTVRNLTVPFLTENTGSEEERERNLVIINK